MKVYTRKIITCLECPNFRQLEDRDTQVDWCRELGEHINPLCFPTPEIPKNCPLPNQLGGRLSNG